MNELLKAAMEYKQAGFSVIAVNEKKESLYKWKKYQNIIIPDKTLIRTFIHPEVNGIAIVCGPVSGNLEIIDMDSKYDLTQTLFKQYIQSLCDASPELLTRLVIASTKNKGYHFFYRCMEIGRSTELARRPCTELEKDSNPEEKVKVLIETKGIGGYVIVPPTVGYQFIQHDLRHTPIIEPAQRDLILSIARSYNLYEEPKPTFSYSPTAFFDPESPFDDFDYRGDIVALLERHGWIVVKQTNIKTYFRRPGRTDHDTSGDYNHKLGLFGVFSTSTEFKAGKGYKPHTVYIILECNGNAKLAAKKLLKEGYGIAYKDRH